MSRYQHDSAGINPEQKYRSGVVEVDAKANNIGLAHESYKHQIDTEAKTGGLGVDEQKFNQIRNTVENQRNVIGNDIGKAKGSQNRQYENIHNEVSQNILDGSKKAKSSALNVVSSILPDYAKSDKK